MAESIEQKFDNELDYFKVLTQYLSRFPPENKIVDGDLAETLGLEILKFFLNGAKANWKDDVQTYEFFTKVSEYEMDKHNDSELQKILYNLEKELSKLDANDKVSCFLRYLIAANFPQLFKLIDCSPTLMIKYYKPDSFILLNAKTRGLTELLQDFCQYQIVLGMNTPITIQAKLCQKKAFFKEKIDQVNGRQKNEIALEVEDQLENLQLGDLQVVGGGKQHSGDSGGAGGAGKIGKIDSESELRIKEDWFADPKANDFSVIESIPANQSESVICEFSDDATPQAQQGQTGDGRQELYVKAVLRQEELSQKQAPPIGDSVSALSDPSKQQQEEEIFEDIQLPLVRTMGIQNDSDTESHSSDIIKYQPNPGAAQERLGITANITQNEVLFNELAEVVQYEQTGYSYDYFGQYIERLNFTRVQERNKGLNFDSYPKLKAFDYIQLQLPEIYTTFPDDEKEITIKCATNRANQAVVPIETFNSMVLQQAFISPQSEQLYVPTDHQVPKNIQNQLIKQSSLCYQCSLRINNSRDADFCANQFCHFSGQFLCKNCKMRKMQIPARVIEGDCTQYNVCAKGYDFIVNMLEKPFVLHEQLNSDFAESERMRRIVRLRAKIIAAYLKLQQCKSADCQISLFLQQEYSHLFKFEPRPKGTLLLSPACLIGDSRDHVGCFEQAVVVSSCKSNQQAVVSVGYWSIQDIIDISEDLLEVQLIFCLKHLYEHSVDCDVCRNNFQLMCCCGKSINLCSPNTTLCRKCGAYICSDCNQKLKKCFVCGSAD